MNYYHQLASEQLEGLRGQEFPPEPDTDDEREAHQRRVSRHIQDACAFGEFLALLAISDSLLAINRTLRRIEKDLHHTAKPTIGLTARLISTEGDAMSVINPLVVPPGFNVQFTTAYTGTKPLVWSSSNSSALNLTVAADGLSALGVRGVDGDAIITVTDGEVTDSETCTVKDVASIGLSSKLVSITP